MWKKVFIALISLVGTFSVVYALNNEMNASVAFQPNLTIGSLVTFGNREMRYTYNDGNVAGLVSFNAENTVVEGYTDLKKKAYISSAQLNFSNNLQLFEKSSVQLSNNNQLLDELEFGKFSSDRWTEDAAFVIKPFNGIETSLDLHFDKSAPWFFKDYLGEWGGTGRQACFYMQANSIDDSFYSCQNNGANSAQKGYLRTGTEISINNIGYILEETVADNKSTSPSLTAFTTATTNMKLGLINRSKSVDVLAPNGIATYSMTQGKSDTKFTFDNATGDVLSVIVSDKNGLAQRWGRVATGTKGEFPLNLSTLEAGKYTLWFFTETINQENSNELSSMKAIELTVVSPQIISYAQTPQIQDIYEYDKNVDEGTKIGTITRSDGAVPIKYEIVSDGDDSYKNFEISGLDENKKSEAASLDVKVKSTGAPNVNATTNSLQAGTYKFCIESTDKNGYPTEQVADKTKVCTSLTVNKTTPTISFADIAQKDMKIGETEYAGLITTSNKDTLEAGKSIKYEMTGGIANILTISTNTTNPLGYKVSIVDTYAGTSLPATFNIVATINPTDNYLGASTKVDKKIYAYKELSSLTWTANKTSYASGDVVANTNIGTLIGVDGVGPFKYEMTTSTDTGYVVDDAKDNASFGIVNGTSVDSGISVYVKTTTSLAVGTYHMQFKVSDAKGKTVVKKAEITVSSQAQKVLDFKDKAGGKIITSTGLTMKFNDSDIKLFAEGGSTGLTIVYGYAPNDKQPSGLNPSSYATINANGSIEPIRTGTIKVQAKSPGNAVYGDAFVYMDLTIDPAEQAVKFNNENTSVGVELNKTITLDASGTVKKDGTQGKGSIVYSSSDESIATVDKTSGSVTGKAVGDVIITAKMNDSKESGYDSNYDTVSIDKAVKIYEGVNATFTQSNTPKAESPSAQKGSPVGSIVADGGEGPYIYPVSTESGDANKDGSFFSVNNAGIVSLNKAINASDIASSTYDAKENVYLMNVQFIVKDNLNNEKKIDTKIKISGATLNAEFDTEGLGKISKTYAPNGSFTLNLSENAGNAIPKYRLKEDATQPSDVLQSVSEKGLVTIQNANDRVTNAKPVMVEAVIPASGGYDGETIEVEVEITKATQPKFGFKKTTINLSTEMSMTPEISDKLSSGEVTLSSENESIVAIDGNTIKANTNEGTTTITAIDAGDRNYRTATNTATVDVTSEPAYGFIISVPSATYGQTNLSATIRLNELEDIHPGAIATQEWVSSDPTVAEIDAAGKITIHKVGEVEITCTQTSKGDPTVRSKAILAIKPKPITVTINDKSKYVGEAMPTFDMTIPDGVLVGSDTITLPTFGCMDSSKGEVNKDTVVGTYDITGAYPTGSNPNYAITITKGVLTIKQDASLTSWYHLEGADSATLLNPNDWHKEDIKVVLNSATESAGTYDEISIDNTLWDSTSITMDSEGEHTIDVSFRMNPLGSNHPEAMSTSQNTTIKIDKSKPVIKSITGTQTNKDSVSQILNQLSFGIFFKPGTIVTIKSEDSNTNPSIEVSGLKEVRYGVYEIDRETGKANLTPIEQNIKIPNANGEIEVKLNDVGLYRVCALTKDDAGNESIESCSDLNVKKIDVDVDKDGTLDFNDPDGDGCPDINIVWKNKDETWTKLNVNSDDDDLPELNIDTRGNAAGSPPDGIADINIDTDDDNIADLNIVDIKTWNPTICVSGQIEEYCTDGSPIPDRNIDFNDDGRPDINIDLDDDGIPDIDIDTDGDGKRDINIDTNQDGTPDEKLKDMKEWILDEKVFEVSGKRFHTMTGLIEDNIDHLEDGGVVAKPGEGQTFLPNYALKVTDKTQELDEETKNNIQGILPDKAFKQYLKIDLTKDNVVIQPDGKVSISIPIDQAIKNPKVMIEQADGTFVEVAGTLKDGIFTYETTFVGGVVVFGDEIKEEPKDPDPVTPETPTLKKPDTSVKGNYTGGIGGAGTGDSINLTSFILSFACAGILSILFYRKARQTK